MTAKGLPKLRLRISGMEKQSEEVRAAVHAGANSGIEKLGLKAVQMVQEKTPVNFGFLTNGITVDFGKGAEIITALVHATPPSDVYAAPVETGSKPHMPPVEALVLWAKKKFGLSDEKEAKRIAWAVAFKIKRDGTKGAWMFKQAHEWIAVNGQQVFEREIAEAITQAGLA